MVAKARNTSGVTLIEAVMAIVVLGIAIPPLVMMFRVVARHSVDASFQDIAVAYANGLMEEIVSKAFEDPDGAFGSFGTEEGSRSAYDDVDDYDGLSNSPPRKLDGTDLDDFAGFTRSAVVENVTAADPDPTTPASDGSTEFKRINVTVAWTGGEAGELTFSTLRTYLVAVDDPLDEAASQATVTDDNVKTLTIDLVSISADDAVLQSFSLSADVIPTRIKTLTLAGQTIWTELPGVELPTGSTAMNAGTTGDRTVLAGQSPTLELLFLANPVGTVAYTLVLKFTDRSRSTLGFSVTW